MSSILARILTAKNYLLVEHYHERKEKFVARSNWFKTLY